MIDERPLKGLEERPPSENLRQGVGGRCFMPQTSNKVLLKRSDP